MARVLVGSIVFVVGVWSLAAAQTLSPTSLPEPSRRFALTNTFSHSRAFPAFSNGYVVSFPRVFNKRQPGVFLVTSLASMQRERVPFRLPDAAEVRVDGVAATPTRHLLVAGSYDRTEEASPVNFLARVDFRGTLVSLTDLGAFGAARVCSTGDDTAWVLGQDWSDEARATIGNQPIGAYDMLRQYGPSGRLKRSFLPRKSLPQGAVIDLHPVGKYYGRDVTPAFLSCGDASVGAYVGYGREPLWFEVPAKGQAARFKVRDIPQSRISGLTLLSPGAVYASFGLHKGSGFLRGLYRLVPETNGTATWTRLNTQGFALLLGRDGPDLIYRQKAGPGEQAVIYASRPPQ
jgi:hypothetical protein